MPVAPAVTVIQGAPLVAVQAQPLVEVTAPDPVPALAASDADVGVTPKVQGAPACVTAMIWPPTVSVPLRGVEDVFAVAAAVTLPVPLPLAPLLIVSQGTLEAAVQAQPVPAVTVALRLPPAAATDRLAGATAKVHGAENTNELDAALVVVPPGPTAATRAS